MSKRNPSYSFAIGDVTVETYPDRLSAIRLEGFTDPNHEGRERLRNAFVKHSGQPPKGRLVVRYNHPDYMIPGPVMSAGLANRIVQHLSARRDGSVQWAERANPRKRKNPMHGPLTISHEGSSLVIRHTNPRGGPPKPKFKMGDRVCDLDGGRPGTVSFIGAYDDFLGGYRYKVQEDGGGRIWHNETNMRKLHGKAKANPRRNPRKIGWQKPSATDKKYGVSLVGYDNAGNRFEIESSRVRGTEYHEVYVLPASGSFGGGVREKCCTRGTLGLAKSAAETYAR